MLIADHINLTFRNPLIGPVLPGEERFPDMSDPYDAALRALAREVARGAADRAGGGRVRAAAGPELRDAGRDPDARAAGRRCGGDVHRGRGDRRAGAGHAVPGFSAVTNPAAGITLSKLRSRRGDGDGADRIAAASLASARSKGSSSAGGGSCDRVVERAVAGAEPGRRRDGAVHEVERVGHRGLERAAERQAGGDRRRRACSRCRGWRWCRCRGRLKWRTPPASPGRR